MLDSLAWLPPRHTTITEKRGSAELTPNVGPDALQVVRLQVAKNLDALKPTELREVTRSLDLVRAAFAHTPQRDALGTVRTMGELKGLGDIVVGAFRPGDIVFFQSLKNVPPLGVLRRQRTDGTLELIAISRGQIRQIKAHVHRRSRRRAHGRILNSFLRFKRPGDAKRTPYLAGQLITAIRRLGGSESER